MDGFEIVRGVGIYRPTAIVTFDSAVQVIYGGIEHAVKEGLTHLLIDIYGLEGFDSPTTAQRYHMVQKWAEVAKDMKRVVMVAPERFIHPNRFGVTVARSLGITAEVFVTDADAMAWLLEDFKS